MARLLDDLLDVTRVSRGTLVLARRRLALSSVFDAAIEVATPAIEARRHQLRVTLPDAPIEIDGDAVRLSQVLSNLLNNAAKYTDAGGTIELSARRIDADRTRLPSRTAASDWLPSRWPGCSTCSRK